MSQFYVIEGPDGAGKSTQFRLAAAALEADGRYVRGLSFPRYDSVGATFVNLYLGGGLGGSPEDTNAYAASTFFACDRYLSYRTEWKADYERDDAVILCCRYTSANAVHQLSKLPREEWSAFLDWLIDYEYVKLGIPSPDRVIYLDMPPELSAELIAKRALLTGQQRDIHEKSIEYIKRCREAAIYAAGRLGWSWINVAELSAGDDGKVFSPRTREDVHAEIMRIITGGGVSTVDTDTGK